MRSDIEIAQSAKLENILQIGKKAGLLEDELIPYGKYKAKIEDAACQRLANRENGRLILVTAVNPTPAGEGKTTTTVALGQAMQRLGENAVIALREPSLGPVFGMKGGAAGGGMSQVLPMEDINLHFTGDIHAITAANNLLCAMIDNHINHGNRLRIDSRRILFSRCMDMNDRALRSITVGMGGKANGFLRQDSFKITVASEVMAILCLAADISDLRERLGSILIGYDLDGAPLYCRDISAHGAMAALLKEALKPNLVQTLEGSPCLIHGGPFANIAHGCNSLRATKLALKLGDWCITEAGFGADLGAEKFFDIKCRLGGLTPSAVVIVATVRALKYNGLVPKNELEQENLGALKTGSANLLKHIENIAKFGIPAVVAINKFPTDTKKELAMLEQIVAETGTPCAISEGFAKGGAGAESLAKAVVSASKQPQNFTFLYESGENTEEKITKIAKEIYGASAVNFEAPAKNTLKEIAALGLEHLPVCIAKTQYSLSDNPTLLGCPKGFEITVKSLQISSGAGFIVALTGDIMTMPGLPKIPSAESIDIDENGTITGLF